MFERIHRFLSPPLFDDEEKTRIARLLQVVLLAMIVGTFLIGLALPIISPNRLHRLGLNIAVIGFGLAHLVLLRRGHVRWAANGFAVFLWAIVTYASATTGGINSTVFAGFVLVIIFAGLLIGPRASLIYAALVPITGLGLMLGERLGWIVNSLSPDSASIGTLLVFTLYAFVTSVLLSLAYNNIRQALDRARAGEQVLAERNHELQSEVLERQRVEEALRTSERQLRLALEAARMRVWHWDLRTNQVSTLSHYIPNTQFDWVRFEEYIARVHPDDQQHVQQAVQKAQETGEYYFAEYRMQVAEDNFIWLESVGEVQRDENGQLLWMQGISRDISERKQNEQQQLELRMQKERLEFLTEFMGNMSHDLRTPLTILQTSIYLLERLTEPEKQHQRLQIMKEQVELIDRYIQDILTISRLDYQPELRLEPLDINRLVRETEQLLRPAAERKNISVELELAEALPPALADHGQMNHAMLNLIENAMNYTPESGSVCIRTCLDGQMITCQITDTGIGIPESEIPRIFDRFYRGDKARLAHKNGTGLGLAIVQKIITMHQGKIEVRSQQGEGSTFQVALPTANLTR
jgi:signal transduction histidine kinase